MSWAELRRRPALIYEGGNHPMSDGDNNFNPFIGFDWKEFEKMLGSRVPFPFQDLIKAGAKDASWVGNYVQQILKQSHLPGAVNSSLDYELFETHKSVICRVNVPKDTNPSLIRLWINSQHLKLEGVPSSRDKAKIPLPAPVIAKTSKAVFKKDVLEIRMPKDSKERGFKEVYVEF
jgi:HSP20 family molecular chaperone IbpA